MRNIFLVVRHEIASMLGRRSFWIMTFVFPLLIVGLNIGVQIVSRDVIEQNRAEQEQLSNAIGYVDHANLIAELPTGVPTDLLVAFPSQETAQAALEAGDLARFYVVPEDYVRSGELVVVERTFAPFALATGGGGAFEYVVQANLLGDQALAQLVMSPIVYQEGVALAPSSGARAEGPFSLWVPYAIMFLLFFALTQSSSLMLQSVSKEKETRTAEVLLLSLRPRELMLGKVVGLGIVAALQLVVWAVGGVLALERGSVAAAANIELSPDLILWGALYFGLGYLLYSCVLAAIGALAPTAREGAQFNFIALLPLMIPLWLNTSLIQHPNGGLALFMSLFPLTAPLGMMTRLVSVSVPLWQPIVSVLGLAVTSYGFVLLSARLFRADTLLSTASLDLKRLVSELRK